MLNRFQHGTIVDCCAGEDLKNNDMYILDPFTRKIRKPICCDEWLTCQVVYVNDVSPNNTIDFCIHKGDFCRCWIVHLVL